MTSISTLWATLDTTVQEWLLGNPGTMMLPRTYVNMTEAGPGQVLRLDAHGEYWLSSADIAFLRREREGGPSTPLSNRLGLDPHRNALDQ